MSTACLWKVTSGFIWAALVHVLIIIHLYLTLYVDESKEKFKVLFAFRIARVIFLSLVESMFSFSFRGVMSCITF